MSGELASDGDRDDRAALAAALECVPALVEPACALVCLQLDGSGLTLPAPLECRART